MMSYYIKYVNIFVHIKINYISKIIITIIIIIIIMKSNFNEFREELMIESQKLDPTTLARLAFEPYLSRDKFDRLDMMHKETLVDVSKTENLEVARRWPSWNSDWPKQLAILKSKSDFLQLWVWLPPKCHIGDFQMLFNTRDDGYQLSTLYDKSKKNQVLIQQKKKTTYTTFKKKSARICPKDGKEKSIRIYMYILCEKKKVYSKRWDNNIDTMFVRPVAIDKDNKEELKTFLQNYTATMDENWEQQNEIWLPSHKVAKHLKKKGTEIFAEIVKFWNGIEYGNQGDYAALDIHLLFEIEHDSDTCVEDNAGPVRVMYPVNALRNLALRYAKSDYVFLLDEDFVPSSNMHALVLSLLRRRPYLVSPKIAFVVPAWE
ncbi:Gyltl1B protein, partial [Reticulomyxa filosa]